MHQVLKQCSTNEATEHLLVLNRPLKGTRDEYQLVEKLNILTSEEYSDLAAQMNGINLDSAKLKNKCNNYSHIITFFKTNLPCLDVELCPFFEQIDVVEASVIRLHEAIVALDRYTRGLGTFDIRK